MYDTLNGLTVSLNDSVTLTSRRAWYSHDLGDLIIDTARSPYGSQTKKNVKSTHIRNQKGYELTNHLGNVQAVVSDKTVARDYDNNDTFEVFYPSVKAVYDYYPFGMLMPGRYVQDTTTQCVTVEHEYGGIFNVRKDGLYGSRGKPKVGMPDQNGFAIGGSTLDVVELGGEDYYSVTAADEGDGMYQPLTLNAEFAHELVLDVPNMTGTWQAVIKQQVDGDWVTIAEENIVSTGQKVIEFTPTETTVQLEVFNIGSGGASIDFGTTYAPYDDWPTSRIVRYCSPKDNYRFGHNGQEKDNELRGIGNSYDYKYRGYDSRIARFMSVDPITKQYPELTPYQIASDNPIGMYELEGLEGVPVARNSMWYMVEGFRQYFDAMTNAIKLEVSQVFYVDQHMTPKESNVKQYERSSNTTKVTYGGWDLFKPNAYTKNSDGTFSNIPAPKIKVTNETLIQKQTSVSQSTPVSTVRTNTIQNSNGSTSTTRSFEIGAKSNSGIPVQFSVSGTNNSNGQSSTNIKALVGYGVLNAFAESEKSSDNSSTIKVGVQSTLETPSVGGVSIGSETTIQAIKEN